MTPPRDRKLYGVLWRSRAVLMAFRIVQGTLKWAAIVLTVLLGLFLLDNTAGLPGGLRIFFLMATVCLIIYNFVLLVVRPILQWPTLDETALILERNNGIERNLLINSFQLGRGEHRGRAAQFVRRMVSAAELKTRDIVLVRGLALGSLIVWTAATVLVIGFWGLYQHRAPLRMRNAALRLVLPLADIPQMGRATLRVYPEFDSKVLEDADLDVVVILSVQPENSLSMTELSNALPRIVVQQGYTEIPDSSVAESGTRMLPVTDHDFLSGLPYPIPGEILKDSVVFRRRIERIAGPLTFRVFCTAARVSGRSIHIELFRAPTITESRFVVTPPPYTGSMPVASPGPPAALSGLAGSTAEIHIDLDRRVDRLVWKSMTNTTEFALVDRSSGAWSVSTLLVHPGSYSVSAHVSGLKYPQTIAEGSVQVRNDLPPTVRIEGDLQRRELISGQNLDLEISGADDFGIASFDLTMRRIEGGAARSIRHWDFGASPGMTGSIRRRANIALLPSIFPPDCDYILEVTCADYCPAGHSVRSEPLLIAIQKPEREDSSETDPAIRDAFDALYSAIQSQERALATSRNMLEYLDDILDDDILDAESGNSFLRHEQALQRIQTDVASHIATAITASAPVEEANAFTATLRGIHRFPARQAIEMISTMGAVSHWLPPNPTPLCTGTFADTNSAQSVYFSSATGRYAALQARSSFSTQLTDIAEIAFVGTDSRPFARKFVQDWHIVATTNSWGSRGRSPSPARDQVPEIFSSAMRQQPYRSGGPSISFAPFASTASNDTVTCYAAEMIHAATNRKIRILTQCSRPMRMWINNWLVMESEHRQADRPDDYETTVPIQPGTNALLLEVSNIGENSSLSLTFADTAGESLALSQEGTLERPPEWRVVHVHSYLQDSSPSAAIDSNESTLWRARGPMPQGIIVDLGKKEVITGFSYLSHPAETGVGIKEYRFFLTDSLTPEAVLPGQLNALILLQNMILDRLMAIRGQALSRNGPDDKGGKTASSAEPAGTDSGETATALNQRVEALLDDVSRFQDQSSEVSEDRDRILEGQQPPDPDQMDTLHQLKGEDIRLAGDIAAAASSVNDLPDADTADAPEADALETLKDNAGKISELADRKAGMPPDQSTRELDSDIDELCRQMEAAGEKLLDSSDRESSMTTGLPPGSDAIPSTPGRIPDDIDDLAADIDMLEHGLREQVESVESALMSDRTDGARVAAGSRLSTGETAEDGSLQGPESPDRESSAGMGQAGMADGKATGTRAESPEHPSRSLPERESTSDAQAGSIAESPSAPADSSTGNGTAIEAETEFGEGRQLEPGVREQLSEIYTKQRRIQEMARVALDGLRKYNMPTSEFEKALAAMARFQKALREADPAAIDREYDAAAMLTSKARRTISERSGLQEILQRARERAEKRVHIGGRSAPPAGYEEMVAAYFRKLAGSEED